MPSWARCGGRAERLVVKPKHIRRAEVISYRRSGVYTVLTVSAPGIAEQVRPGNFVSFSVGGEESGLLLRRAFSVLRAEERGVYGATVDVLVAPTGCGTRWLARRRPGDMVDVAGPLGRPFRLPKSPANAVLVAGGYGVAPLIGLAVALRARGCRVDFAVGASNADRLFGVLDAKRNSTIARVLTEDGSLGERGRVTDVLPGLMERANSEVAYACGPMGMLAAVAELAAQRGMPSQVAVEESMACGFGVCMTCVLPVAGADGTTRMVRSCVEGPVFEGESVRFADVGTVPADVYGAAGSPGEGEPEPYSGDA